MGFVIAGNWKMNGTPASAAALASGLAGRVGTAKSPAIVLCPPAPLLSAVVTAVAGSPIAAGGQDCHPKEKGAHTGDISAALLAEIGCRYVIVGHSERRADHGETDALVRAKAEAALKAGLMPIICLGETDAQREAGETDAIVARQVKGSFPKTATAANAIIAYEPVWAIGTGKVATTADIAAVHAQIRKVYDQADAGALRILYGGSVKGSNAAEILATAGVNGALVGGASLDLEDFWRIIQACPSV
jgi:triosephosphate isomerase